MRSAIAAVVVAGLGLLAAGCGGGGQEPFRIGFVQSCKGNPAVEESFAGAELAFLRRGGEPLGKRPSAGVGSIEIAGTRVELLTRCAPETASGLLDETRRLVEVGEADAVVVSSVTDPGVREYARTQPDASFFPMGWWGQSLRDPLPNLFSFLFDAHQLTAGLGTYAYRDLGWRTAAVVHESYAFPYGESAGFIAEFCALGGTVTKRIDVAFGARDYAPIAASIPTDVDGYFVSVLSGNFTKLVKAWRSLPDKLGGAVLTGNVNIGATEFEELGERLLGVSQVTPLANPTLKAAFAELVDAFPDAGFDPDKGQLAYGLLAANQIEGAVQALEAADGDPGTGQERFRDALRGLKLDARTFGVLAKLDERGQMVSDVRLSSVEGEDGNLAPRAFRTIKAVDQTFGGLFGPATPPFGPTSPPCRKGNPPPWAR